MLRNQFCSIEGNWSPRKRLSIRKIPLTWLTACSPALYGCMNTVYRSASIQSRPVRNGSSHADSLEYSDGILTNRFKFYAKISSLREFLVEIVRAALTFLQENSARFRDYGRDHEKTRMLVFSLLQFGVIENMCFVEVKSWEWSYRL